MALGGRSPRPSRGRWWLIVGAGLTIVILVISGALHARSQGPLRTESAQAWVDRVLPLISQSTSEGNEINQVRVNGLTMSGQTVVGELNTAATDATRTLKRFRALDPPADVTAASGLLQTALTVRAQAAKSMASAVSEALSGTDAKPPPAASIAGAAQNFQVADRSYVLFAKAMPDLGVKIPSSVWLPNPGLYGRNSLNVFLAALKARTSTAPVHDVAVVAITTNPSPLSVRGHVQMIEPASTVSMDVVVANLGNQPEFNVAVSVTISPPKKGTTATRHVTVNLAAGQAETVAFSGLHPAGAGTFQLRAQIATVTGETNTANNAKTLTFQQVSS